jgi:pSer/pThr/pTyr-binding forkhead associated (FHA) protein
MKVRLHTVDPWVPELRLVVKEFPAVVGRDPDADVRTADPWVSRVHCELYDVEGMLAVRDLGSRHGTFINGVKVTDSILMPGDELQVGMSRLEVSYKRKARKPVFVMEGHVVAKF